MARSCQKIFLTVFLCVVVLFLTGVAFPKFLATQNVKLRTIFNSSVASLKFSSREQLVSNKTEGGNLVNGNIFESKNEDKPEKFSENFLRNTALNSLQTQKLERNKRQIVSQEVPKEVFAWNFNLNVSRLEKTTPNEAAKKDLKTSPSKQLEVAVYVENQGSQETAFSELQKDLGIVGGLVKTIFSSGTENGTNDLDMNGMEIKQLTIGVMGVRSDLTFTQNFSNRGSTEKVPEKFTKILPALKEQFPTSVLKTLPNPDTLNFEDEANKTESHDKRKGRIFGDIFGLKAMIFGRTTPVSETEETKNLMDNIETEGNIFTENESLLGHPKSEFVTKHFQQASSFPSDSLLSESENSTKHVFDDDNMEKLSLQPTRQQHGCPDCVTGSFGLSVFPSKENEVSVSIVLETTQAETLFTNEILEKHCESLLNTLEEYQPTLREESLKTDTGMIEDSFVINTDEPTTESLIFTDKPRRFFGIFDGGSGRSEILPYENNLLSERQTDEVEDLPSVLDCEEFFNKKQNRKIFPTPNSLDTNDLENTILPNFGNSTLSPKLKEQLLQLSTNLSSSVKMSDTVSEGKADSLESGTSAGNESDFTVNKDLFINENGEITTEFSDLDLNDTLRTSESTDADSEVQITDEQREGRFFNFFNFGSGSDVQENINVSESQRFLGGSGANSLGTSRDEDESGKNIALGSEESFPEIEAFSGDGRMLDVSDGDLLENFSTTSDKGHRFFNFLGFAGSGSGREFIDSTELTVTELDVKLPYTGSENFSTEAPLSSQSLSGLNDEYEDDCSDCNHEYNLHYEKLLSETSKSYDNINSNSTITNLEHESRFISFHSNGVNDTDYHDYATPNIDSLNVTENSNRIQTTEIKPRRFMETLFLTGSGDGGLFADDGGPINLVEEESTIRPVEFPRRKGRLDDSLLEACDGDCADLSDLLRKSVETARSNQTASHFSSSTIKFNGTMSPVSRPKSEATTVQKGLTETDITFSSGKFSSPFPSLTPTELQPRSCVAARECNITLGERCITISSSSVCDCGRTFVRHKETRKCVAKGHIETKLKFPAEMFDSELDDRESPRYKLTSKKAVDTTWLLLGESPDVYRIVADVNVTNFTAGSLIISLELVLAVENEAEADTIKDMAGKLQKALADEKLIKRASLNIRNATVLFLTSELDPCKSTELNYCSKNAVCVRNEAFPGRHTCFCKEHYLDVSSDPLFPGETCIDKCPPSYCGPNGHCEILKNKERHCLCTGLYFGERCEVSGVVVIGSLSIAAFITLAVLVAVIIRLRCNKSYGSYGRTPTFRRSEEIGPHVIAGSRVSDAIALGEIRETKISKFSQISTPVQNLPVIKVTQPTLNESSISFDFDSTFETTSSVHEQRSENGNSTV